MGEVAGRDEIKGLIREKWSLIDGLPYSTQFILSDNKYWLPSVEKVKALVVNTFFEGYRYKLEVMDCDDYACILNAFVKQERYVEIEEGGVDKAEWYSWAFGICYGYFRGKGYRHAINVVVSEVGVLLIEPQAVGIDIWRPKEGDEAYFIYI